LRHWLFRGIDAPDRRTDSRSDRRHITVPRADQTACSTIG